MSSFNDMMQQAIKIRTSTDAKLRVDFDARPKFQQTSLYALPQVREARSMPLAKRLDACIAMKEDGNRQLQSGRPEEACHTYEQALAMFWYLDNQNEKWKTSGVKDEDIFEINFTPSEEEVDQEQRIRNLKVALLLNISRAYSAQNDYGTSRRACTVALSLDPSSAKALYLRAKLLVCPASAGAFETEEAIRDLSRAVELAPGDRMVRALLSKLRAERTRQREIDRATFAGMFSRGSVCGASKSPEHATESAHGFPQAGGHNSAVAGVKGDAVNHGDTRVAQPRAPGGEPDDRGAFPVGTRKEVEARLTFLERLASECDDEDREEEGKGYRERIKAVRDALAQHDADEKKRAAMMDPSLRVDWRHPNQELRKRAEEDELDLDNPLVVNFLMKMEDAAQRKKTRRGVGTEHQVFPAGSLETGVGEEGGGGVSGSWPNNSGSYEEEEWSKETCEGAIRCMSRTEVTSLLQDAAVVPEPGMTLRQLRDLAVKKLVEDVPAHGDGAKGGSTTRKSAAKKDTRRNAADWKISLVITLAIVLFKTYQMGLFSWIVNGAIPRAAPGAPRSGHRIEDRRGTHKTPEMPFDHVDGHLVDSNTEPTLLASSTNFPGQQGPPNKELSTDGGSDSKGLSGSDLMMMEQSADHQYYEGQAIEESEAESAGNPGSTLATEETNVEKEF